MTISNGLFTSESVSAGHPDKLCDQISDAVLDEFLRVDPSARVACETFAHNDRIIVAGEFRTTSQGAFEAIRRRVPPLVRDTLRRIGYGSSELDIDPSICEIDVRFNRQSPQIAAGVDGAEHLAAGDQGMMIGYATDETPHMLPLPLVLAHALLRRLQRARESSQGPGLRPDAKAQVTVQYCASRPIGIDSIVISTQHSPDVSVRAVRDFVNTEIIDQVIPPSFLAQNPRRFVNPAGAWTIGGPKGDTGLTGRKIVVDTYGSACPHGGGAFSGKDASKVDRSGAYMARYMAKHVVAAELAKRCTVQLAYAIGCVQPISLGVDLHGSGIVDAEYLAQALQSAFDLTPDGIIDELGLDQPIYQPTATYGHFGESPDERSWERTPHVQQ